MSTSTLPKKDENGVKNYKKKLLLAESWINPLTIPNAQNNPMNWAVLKISKTERFKNQNYSASLLDPEAVCWPHPP